MPRPKRYYSVPDKPGLYLARTEDAQEWEYFVSIYGEAPRLRSVVYSTLAPLKPNIMSVEYMAEFVEINQPSIPVPFRGLEVVK